MEYSSADRPPGGLSNAQPRHYNAPMFAWLLKTIRTKGLMPRMSETERQALEAGSVWIDGDLFSGRPDLRRLASIPYSPEAALTSEEQTFLDGPVNEVCRMVDDWQLQRSRELPPAVWDLLRRERFFGLTLPTEHGGRGFSSLAASTVFGKLASRSLGLSAVVLIPNSVGPGELLLEYGTDAQKRKLLPRLARGDEIPCFALTEPEAGSDAASLTSRGVVFRGESGRPMMRLTWEKRYITLAPVATLLGLAVRLEDPEELLAQGPEPGITLVLVPTDSPGVEVGRYHDPMGVPFPNGPTRGREVVLPVDRIVGGPERAGQGWRMLMEALSAGRSISLPAQSVGGAKAVAFGIGAYAMVRRQFGMPVGRFEGVEEPLARIAGRTYLMEAARVATCRAVDAGERPAVVSGVVKYQQTELLRQVVTDAMDVAAGAGLSLGPRNLMARGWIGAPIGITVEGANILTRTLIVFGQGTLRSHPRMLPLVRAVEANDARAFRRALLGHARSATANLLRAPWRSVTGGLFVRSPVPGPTAPFWRRLARASASFAALADLALVAYGARLKFRGKQAGRFADALSWMVFATCTLRRFDAEGSRPEDLPFVRWAAAECLSRADRALHEILTQFEGPAPLCWLLRGPVALWSRLNPIASPPDDRLGAQVAEAIRRPGSLRNRLTAATYVGDPHKVPDNSLYVHMVPDNSLARLEEAFRLAAEAEPLLARLRRAARSGAIPGVEDRAVEDAPEETASRAVVAGVLDEAEAETVRLAAALRREVIQVDEFSREEYLALARTAPERAQEPVDS